MNDQQINKYINGLITQYFTDNPHLSGLAAEQKSSIETTLRGILYKSAVEELINRLNEDQINQVADLDFTSPEMLAKLEQFAATMPDFLSALETRFQQELANFHPTES